MTTPSWSARDVAEAATASGESPHRGTTWRPSLAMTQGRFTNRWPSPASRPAATNAMVSSGERVSSPNRFSARSTLTGSGILAPAPRQSLSTCRHLPAGSRTRNGSVAGSPSRLAVSVAVRICSSCLASNANWDRLNSPCSGMRNVSWPATRSRALAMTASSSLSINNDALGSSATPGTGMACQAASGSRPKRSSAAFDQSSATSETNERFHSLSEKSRRLASGSNWALANRGRCVRATGRPA